MRLASSYVAVLVALLLTLSARELSGTAQEHEILRLGESEVGIMSTPLRPWLAENPNAIPASEIISTGRWRGYLGVWEVQSGKLLLIDLLVLRRVEEAEKFETEDVSVLSQVFPPGAPVVATWYSGFLVVAKGDMDEYVHMGYASKFSEYLVIEVVSGRVVAKTQMGSEEFEQFRKSQFQKYQQTSDYRAFLVSTMADGQSEDFAVEFIYKSASVYYLSVRFETEDPGPNEK